jgi:two-component system, response regulator, stage 0 sporulation protein F
MDNNISVLYIDDEPLNLMLFTTIFKNWFVVATAESGREGLKILNDCQYIKIVISDMKMPVMDGMEFITEARKTRPDIAFYILSGFEINAEIENALSTGLIRKYFQKPFSKDEILSVIHQNE